MKHHYLFGFLAVGTLGVAGCGTDYSGTYKGEATESGTMKIAVAQTAEVAKNESPPRKVPDATVTVSKDGNGYVVKFASCEMKGEASTPKLVVVKNTCDVKVANWEGKLPLSATLNFDDTGALSMEVTGTTKNEATVISYDWTFKGKK
ncbi:hypothetical protein [Polyangium jinanense]|uniref:Lipoprotein n=1 Tax=Polyangium jinanense TaxID=2829994 RepID=A0A9X3XG17_9BACT|nr:hypothetical protein [Polyangium jinanense]MDC3962731.1 hypothetical protein [Polyangium jinanense]MDC3989337.1 hypothetical protein [Polyangium jinanense]